MEWRNALPCFIPFCRLLGKRRPASRNSWWSIASDGRSSIDDSTFSDCHADSGGTKVILRHGDPARVIFPIFSSSSPEFLRDVRAGVTCPGSSLGRVRSLSVHVAGLIPNPLRAVSFGSEEPSATAGRITSSVIRPRLRISHRNSCDSKPF